tara:strand:+ start:403 stop:630 length:228 start_codon:yes stop_codon:yes gene_type:complete
MEASDRFQGLCLEGAEGSLFMNQFDELPKRVKKRLAESPFNICTACVIQKAGGTDEVDLLKTISSFEARIASEAV